MERRGPERPTYGFTVAAAVDAVPAARRQVVSLAQDLGLPLSDQTLETVELLAGEVIADAVLYTHAPCDVSVRRAGERLRAEVRDTDASLPGAVEVGPNDESGRGLLLVSALRDHCGLDSRAGGSGLGGPRDERRAEGYDWIELARIVEQGQQCGEARADVDCDQAGHCWRPATSLRSCAGSERNRPPSTSTGDSPARSTSSCWASSSVKRPEAERPPCIAARRGEPTLQLDCECTVPSLTGAVRNEALSRIGGSEAGRPSSAQCA
jgi:hypothetical protein